MATLWNHNSCYNWHAFIRLNYTVDAMFFTKSSVLNQLKPNFITIAIAPTNYQNNKQSETVFCCKECASVHHISTYAILFVRSYVRSQVLFIHSLFIHSSVRLLRWNKWNKKNVYQKWQQKFAIFRYINSTDRFVKFRKMCGCLGSSGKDIANKYQKMLSLTRLQYINWCHICLLTQIPNRNHFCSTFVAVTSNPNVAFCETHFRSYTVFFLGLWTP